MRHTNIVVALDKRRVRKDGTYPLMLRLSHEGKTMPVSLGIYIQEKDFDPKRRIIRNTYKGTGSVTRLNNDIQKRKASVMDIINKLEEADELYTLSITQIKERITAQRTGGTFFTYAQECIEGLRKAQKFGNARTYGDALKALKNFRKGVDFPLHHFNYDLVKKFETYYLAKGNSYNGLSVHLRTLRAIYNRAISQGLVEKGSSPFETYKIKSEPTQKRALSIISLRKIVNLDIDPSHDCFDARNFFLASFYMYGISFIDMAFLRMSNIIDGRIRFKRRKTGKAYDLKITDQLKQILDYYTEGKEGEDFIFPVITRDELENQYKDVGNRRLCYNRALKDLAKLAKVDEKLTSYVSRHSFATQAMMQDIPLQAISAMLGHSRLSTTEVYLKALPNEVLDEYNSKITLE